MANSLIQAGQRITASLINSVAPLGVIKGADETVSNTTLQNDNELFIPLAANSSYYVEVYLDWEGASGSGLGLQWTWTVPAGGTFRYQGVYLNTAGTPALILATHAGSDNPAAGGNGAGSLVGLTMKGTIVTSSAGNLQLQWAQAGTSGTPTIVHAQSSLAVWQQTP